MFVCKRETDVEERAIRRREDRASEVGVVAAAARAPILHDGVVDNEWSSVRLSTRIFPSQAGSSFPKDSLLNERTTRKRPASDSCLRTHTHT